MTGLLHTPHGIRRRPFPRSAAAAFPCRNGAAGDRLLPPSPILSHRYSIFASINDVRTVDVPLSPSDFQLLLPALTAALTPQVKLIFLCSPGNPTSRLLRTADVEAVAAAATGALVVVDEAYIDYAPDALSCAEMVGRIPNLVVMQTFSKAWGLAGARVGFAMAPEALVAVVDRVKAPFNLSALAEEAATRAVAAADKVREQRDGLLLERTRVAAALRAPAFGHAVRRVVPSDANFLLVQIDDCRAVCEQLGRAGVVVRYRGDMLHCTECARVSVGTREENDTMLAALARAVGLPV
eukprot:scaffold6413_cov121-Isochrysis_galbana.AAC.12